MDYAEYVRRISFRLLQPTAPRPPGFAALSRLARKAGLHMEMWMTQLPEGQQEMQDRLRRLCRRRHKGTFAIGALINRAVAAMPDDQVCLHLGVGGGFPLFAGMADNSGKCCVGVDDLAGRRQSSSARLVARFVHRQGPRDEIHVVDVRKYLMSVHRRPIGVCVCNRPPGYAALLERLQLAEPFFADGAILMLNDANSLPIRQAAFDYVASSPFEYRTLLDVQTPRSGHPTFWNGLMVLARGLPRAGAAFATERAA